MDDRCRMDIYDVAHNWVCTIKCDAIEYGTIEGPCIIEVNAGKIEYWDEEV